MGFGGSRVQNAGHFPCFRIIALDSLDQPLPPLSLRSTEVLSKYRRLRPYDLEDKLA
jgi:hypothetical protein